MENLVKALHLFNEKFLSSLKEKYSHYYIKEIFVPKLDISVYFTETKNLSKKFFVSERYLNIASSSNVRMETLFSIFSRKITKEKDLFSHTEEILRKLHEIITQEFTIYPRYTYYHPVDTAIRKMYALVQEFPLKTGNFNNRTIALYNEGKIYNTKITLEEEDTYSLIRAKIFLNSVPLKADNNGTYVQFVKAILIYQVTFSDIL
ncbi:MAG: hypothetical protein QXX30_00280 [Candidatus Aenigmatarchaeota archaeon]